MTTFQKIDEFICKSVIVIIIIGGLGLFSYCVYDLAIKKHVPYISWELKYIPITDDEKQKVAHHVENILPSQSLSLSAGAFTEEQYENVLTRAHEEAVHLYCTPTLWETVDGYETGRWKYKSLEQIK